MASLITYNSCFRSVAVTSAKNSTKNDSTIFFRTNIIIYFKKVHQQVNPVQSSPTPRYTVPPKPVLLYCTYSIPNEIDQVKQEISWEQTEQPPFCSTNGKYPPEHRGPPLRPPATIPSASSSLETIAYIRTRHDPLGKRETSRESAPTANPVRKT